MQISKLFNISFLSKRLYGGSLVFIFSKQSSPWNSLDFNKNSSERNPRNSTKFLNLCKLSSFFFKISVTLTKYNRLYLNNFTSLNSNNTQIKLISSKYYATWPLLFSTESMSRFNFLEFFYLWNQFWFVKIACYSFVYQEIEIFQIAFPGFWNWLYHF